MTDETRLLGVPIKLTDNTHRLVGAGHPPYPPSPIPDDSILDKRTKCKCGRYILPELKTGTVCYSCFYGEPTCQPSPQNPSNTQNLRKSTKRSSAGSAKRSSGRKTQDTLFARTVMDE